MSVIQTHPQPVPKKDALGCAAGKLSLNQELHADDLTLYRKSTRDDRFGSVGTAASDRGFLVGVALRSGHRRRIFDGRRVASHDFELGSIYIRDFTDDYRADLHGGFDFLMVELSRSFIERLNAEKGGPPVHGLLPKTGAGDPVLTHLAQAASIVLDQPGQAGPLLVDHLGVALGSHLLAQYGNRASSDAAWPEVRSGRVLSRALERRAKEMLLANMEENLSVADIADACRLSRSYFIKAFRQTVGMPPHRWLLEQRVRKACDLLREPGRSIAEIALSCGFSDQPHLTRVFTKVMGVSPAAWRRQIAA